MIEYLLCFYSISLVSTQITTSKSTKFYQSADSSKLCVKMGSIDDNPFPRLILFNVFSTLLISDQEVESRETFHLLSVTQCEPNFFVSFKWDTKTIAKFSIFLSQDIADYTNSFDNLNFDLTGPVKDMEVEIQSAMNRFTVFVQFQLDSRKFYPKAGPVDIQKVYKPRLPLTQTCLFMMDRSPFTTRLILKELPEEIFRLFAYAGSVWFIINDDIEPLYEGSITFPYRCNPQNSTHDYKFVNPGMKEGDHLRVEIVNFTTRFQTNLRFTMGKSGKDWIQDENNEPKWNFYELPLDHPFRKKMKTRTNFWIGNYMMEEFTCKNHNLIQRWWKVVNPEDKRILPFLRPSPNSIMPNLVLWERLPVEEAKKWIDDPEKCSLVQEELE